MKIQTSLNKRLTLRRLFGGSGFSRLGHGYAIPTPPSPTFQPTANLRFALKGGLERRQSRTLCDSYKTLFLKIFKNRIFTIDMNY